MHHLSTGIGLLAIIRQGDRIELANRLVTLQQNTWVFPGNRRTGFHLCPRNLSPLATASTPFSHEIIYASAAFSIPGIPVLHRRVLYLGTFHRHQFNYCGMQLVFVSHRRSTALEIADVTPLICHNQRSFKLPCVHGIDSEISRQLHRTTHSLGHIDKRSVTEHS